MAKSCEVQVQGVLFWGYMFLNQSSFNIRICLWLMGYRCKLALPAPDPRCPGQVS